MSYRGRTQAEILVTTVDRRAERDAKARAAQRERERADRVARAVVDHLAAAGFSATACRRQLIQECRQHGVTIRWIANPMKGLANVTRRVIHVAPVRDLYTAAIAWHEYMHVRLGRCPRTGAHQRADNGYCLECERAAWAGALAAMPALERPILRVMRVGLGSYVTTTPAPAATKAAAVRLSGSVSFYERVQRRQKFRDAVAKQERVRRELQQHRRT
jgi:hypothetical protein